MKSLFQRAVLLIKVLVLLSLGMSAAWANNTAHAPGTGVFATGDAAGAGLQLAKSESEPGDEGQGGSEGDDDSTTDDPGIDNPDDGDSQT